MWSIHELTPAPYGDNYRLVEWFATEEHAKKVLKVLESVNYEYKVYKIYNWKQ